MESMRKNSIGVVTNVASKPLEFSSVLRHCLNKLLELCTKYDSETSYSSFCDCSHKLVFIEYEVEDVLAKEINLGSVL